MRTFLRLAFVLAVVLSLFGKPARAADAAAAETSSYALPATDEGLPGRGPFNRSDWFKGLWLEHRSGWAKRIDQDQDALIFLGDSITDFWTDLPAYFPGVKIVNRGIAGDTTRGVLVRLQQDVIALHPRGVVLLIGTNDLWEWASPDETVGNLKLILAALRDYNPRLPVVLCKLMPSAADLRRPSDRLRKLNELYAQAAAAQPQVTVLDTWTLFASAKSEAKPEEFGDLLHPNALGYAQWAAALRPVLEARGLIPAWPDDFVPEAGFVALENGRDLGGWRCADTGHSDLVGATSFDGTFSFANSRIVATGRPTAPVLSSDRPLAGDFVLKLEFRATPAATGSVFLGSTAIPCNDYALAGPAATLAAYRPLDWNELTITVRSALAHVTCNGAVLFDALTVAPNASLGLQPKVGQLEFRRIRVQPLK
jgi:lysophospholipase L1-like esterase